MKPTLILLTIIMAAVIIPSTSNAQQYKLRQVNAVMGMKSESTIYVKGPRKRTEGSNYMGQPAIVTIEQCDKQRTIKINDKKKMYFIEPFSADKEEIIDEDVKQAKQPVQPKKTTTEKGGVITMWYNITDTGERKKMYGFTARHVWTYQKIKPSPDACMMKDSMIMKTDGWYIDLPEFNCPVRYSSYASAAQYQQPSCQDRFVTRRSGKGKLGFALQETRTIIMNGVSQTTDMTMTLETLEFSTQKLDSMLFEIPAGYTLVNNEADLQDKYDVSAIINQAKQHNENSNKNQHNNSTSKPGAPSIAILPPTGEESLPVASLQQQLAQVIGTGNFQAVIVSSEEEARQKNCSMLLYTNFTRLKQTSKVGGMLKAIKNTDPNAATSFNIDADLVVKLGDGSVKTQERVSGKYEGRAEDAAKLALTEGAGKILSKLY